MWGQNLNQRPEEEKRTLKGKEASAIHTQTVSYLKPLFRKLKHKVLMYNSVDTIYPVNAPI